jgi:hypothetical protein
MRKGLTPKFRKKALQHTPVAEFSTGISPPVYRSISSYEARYDQDWPHYQSQGDNRQSMYRFGLGLDKENLAHLLDRQLEEDAASLISSKIRPSDRLLYQQFDQEYGDPSRLISLYKEANRIFSYRKDESGQLVTDFHLRLEEEDTLYDTLDHFAAQGPKAQFYILGDTNHRNPIIRSSLSSKKMLETFAKKDCAFAFIEWNESIQPLVEAYQSGALSRNDFVHRATEQALDDIQQVNTGTLPTRVRRGLVRSHLALADTIDNARDLGLQAFCIDRREGIRYHNGKPIIDYKVRLDADANLARRIKAIAGDRSAVIIYGGAHGAYRDTLDDCLGVDNTVRMNVHANLRQYHCSTIRNRCHIDSQPRYIYLAEEDRVIAPTDNYGRRVDIDCDPIQLARDPEIAALHERRQAQRRAYAERYKMIIRFLFNETALMDKPHKVESNLKGGKYDFIDKETRYKPYPNPTINRLSSDRENSIP